MQVTNGDRVVCVDNGTPLLTAVTAAGCSVTALCAAFVSVALLTSNKVQQQQQQQQHVGNNPSNAVLLATAHAMAVFG